MRHAPTAYRVKAIEYRTLTRRGNDCARENLRVSAGGPRLAERVSRQVGSAFAMGSGHLLAATSAMRSGLGNRVSCLLGLSAKTTLSTLVPVQWRTSSSLAVEVLNSAGGEHGGSQTQAMDHLYGSGA